MPIANMSVRGLYDWNNTLFDNLVVPNGMDKTIVVDNILYETAELEVLFPDFDIMKDAIGRWSNKEIFSWNKLYASTNFVYNPIWNKDGTISETITETRNLANSTTESASSQTNGSSTTDQDTTSSSTDKVSAYNSADFENRNQTSGSGTNDVSVTDQTTSQSANTQTGTDTGTVIHVTARTEQGNIGVTSTQQLIREEREIDEFNMYSYIVNAFKNRFCLLIY